MNDSASGSEAADFPLREYAPLRGVRDEVLLENGEPRNSWQELRQLLAGVGASELRRRWTQVQEEIHATGIAYNVFDEKSVVARPWTLDLLPLLIDADEWNELAAGLRQRAALLNRVLADLHGPQRLLGEGLLPASWLYSHPGFHRVFHGNPPHGGTFLHFYAADLERGEDGRWWVVEDRTDSPLGLGFALENRILTSRMLPNAISQMRVERLATFFSSLQTTLRDLAPTQRDNPRVVLLSQGPSGPNYFEDAYLARYLGYTLVEGGDLAVRDDRVFLKTLSGLLPVDVIFRRLSDAFCDPLEVRSDAGLGIPGSAHAARCGNVAVVNTLGSSLAESPSLMPFLPSIAERWLETSLTLPSVETLWCGQADSQQRVEEILAGKEFEDYAIRAAYRAGRRESYPVAKGSDIHRDSLRKLIAERPEAWIARRRLHGSTAPVWYTADGCPWRVALRVYVVAVQGGYEVMPGGLARLSRDGHALEESILGGEVSRDVWARSHGPVRQFSLLPTDKRPVELRRSGAELPSRVADNLFWFGRNLERAQGACRLLRLIAGRLTGDREVDSAPEVDALVRCMAELGQIEPGFVVEGMRDRLPTIASQLPQCALDESQGVNFRASVASAHRNASLVRDRLSLDIWRITHRLERLLAIGVTRWSSANEPDEGELVRSIAAGMVPETAPFGLIELDELLDESMVLMASLDGMIAESMTRSPAWRFLDLGRRIERAMFVVALVRASQAEHRPDESRILEAILEVADSIMTYRGRYLTVFHRAAALDLLITDDSNPRSLAYQLSAITEHVRGLPRGVAQPLGTAEERIAISLAHGVRMLGVDDLSDGGGERTNVGRLLVRINDQLPKLSDVISHHYLIHAGRPQQMSRGT